MRAAVRATTLFFAITLASCGEESKNGVDLSRPVAFEADTVMPKRLSTLNLFEWNGDEGFRFNERVVPYDLNTPLFSDYALKARAIYVPEGVTIDFRDSGPLEFPVGTVLIKNFYFPADLRQPEVGLRLIETRLLVRRASGWEAYPYIWNAAQTDAELKVGGETRAISFIGYDGVSDTASYLVPQRNQCIHCHGHKPDLTQPTQILPIGPTARNLNRLHDYGSDAGTHNQLDYLASLGMLSNLPDVATVDATYDFRPIEEGGVAAIPPADVERAARDYLEVNCAHCHNPNSPNGAASQLYLLHTETNPYNLGVCKRPGSAGPGTGGHAVDVLPGNAAESILYFRVQTEQQGAMMPLLGRSVTHRAGAELVGAWIDAMPAQTCNP